MDEVSYGLLLHDENSYHLMRRYDSLTQRDECENGFYGSAEWRQGPREAILTLIENYTEIVFDLDEVTLKGVRKRTV